MMERLSPWWDAFALSSSGTLWKLWYTAVVWGDELS
jgi:hypothetical protein